uniref:Transposon TX1 uncharacterized n=1 Tax=Cajanus cajan TaxID=3821 RepID=A0A151TZL5_CAJCA|nr:Transposon TX1 uncharacterized [Cajanus cajan]
MKGDIIRFITEFHSYGKLPKGTNSTFITDNPQHLGEYRPISLVGCMYKILSKILANRLKKVLPNAIDDRQSAFLEGRNLLNSVLVVNKALDEAKRKKKETIFVKVDFEKAYDSVNWNYLLYMLNRLGFHKRWVSWISKCLLTSHVFVLVNGSPTEELKMHRGFRQGGPLSPFLYTVVVKGLIGMMREATEKKSFQWSEGRKGSSRHHFSTICR